MSVDKTKEAFKYRKNQELNMEVKTIIVSILITIFVVSLVGIVLSQQISDVNLKIDKFGSVNSSVGENT